MKKVDYAQKALGMVFSPDFGDHIQSGMIGRFEALIKGLVGVNNLVIKLWGCDIVVAGQDYTMSAGALYYNGVIYTVDAFAGTAPAGEVGLWTIDDTYTGQSRFGDDHLKDTFLENKMTLSFGASGSGIADHDAAITIEDQIYIHATVQAKTQALIDASIAALVDSSPGTLDTLNELAAALGDDPDFATTMTNALAGKVAIADVINVLTSTETQKPLSAAQGKALNDTKIAISAIVNNLTSTATNQPLSAAQGKILNDNMGGLKFKVVDIGDWDMGAVGSITIDISTLYGINPANVRRISAMIRDDSDLFRMPLDQKYVNSASIGTTDGTVQIATGGLLLLARRTGGGYDAANYSATTYNRGWITIEYV